MVGDMVVADCLFVIHIGAVRLIVVEGCLRRNAVCVVETGLAFLKELVTTDNIGNSNSVVTLAVFLVGADNDIYGSAATWTLRYYCPFPLFSSSQFY